MNTRCPIETLNEKKKLQRAQFYETFSYVHFAEMTRNDETVDSGYKNHS